MIPWITGGSQSFSWVWIIPNIVHEVRSQRSLRSKARLGRRSVLQKKKWWRMLMRRKTFESDEYYCVSLCFSKWKMQQNTISQIFFLWAIREKEFIIKSKWGKVPEFIIQIKWGCGSFGRTLHHHAANAGLISQCGQGFPSQSQLLVQTLCWCPYTLVCSCMHEYLCTRLKSCSQCQSLAD